MLCSFLFERRIGRHALPVGIDGERDAEVGGGARIVGVVAGAALHLEYVLKRAVENVASAGLVRAVEGATDACVSGGQRTLTMRALGKAATVTASSWLPPSRKT